MYARYELHFSAKIKLLSGQIQIITLFKNINEIKRRRCDKNIDKAMKITVKVYQISERFFVTFHPKYACKLEFADHLRIPLIGQPQSGIVLFSIITFHL